MAKSGKPPKWRKGRHELELALTAGEKKSGKDETVRLGLRWEVRPTKPKTERDWTNREMQCARDLLERAAKDPRCGQWFKNDLDAAFIHAVTAWCRAHLHERGASNADNYLAFLETAPEVLRAQDARATTALHGLARGTVAPLEAIATVRTTAEALLKAVANPPKNRRRFPPRTGPVGTS